MKYNKEKKNTSPCKKTRKVKGLEKLTKTPEGDWGQRCYLNIKIVNGPVQTKYALL